MNILLYLIYNFGFLLILSVIGFLSGTRKERILTLPFLCIFILAFICRATWYGNIDQKLIFFGGLYFIFWASKGAQIIMKRFFIMQLLGIVLIILSSISGFLDFMVIKNDFMYPVNDVASDTFMSWISHATKPDAVFLSFPDIFDPVTLTGRRNYWGFYKNFGSPDRSKEVQEIYENPTQSAVDRLRQEHVEYLLVPKMKRPDFYAIAPLETFKLYAPVVYEDARYIVFQLQTTP